MLSSNYNALQTEEGYQGDHYGHTDSIRVGQWENVFRKDTITNLFSSDIESKEMGIMSLTREIVSTLSFTFRQDYD